MNKSLIRGCGSRKAGGLYLVTEMSPYGRPFNYFMLDPPVEYTGPKFQGIQVSDYTIEGITGECVILLDMVGLEFYPTMPAFVEEARRFGVSRRIPVNFDFSKLAGKTVYLGTIHWRAIPMFDKKPELGTLPPYWTCFRPNDPAHYPDCVYHAWPIAPNEHDKLADDGAIEMPWGSFNPHGLFQAHPDEQVIREMRNSVTGYKPGIFALWPITKIEAVKYIPEGTNVIDSEMPIDIVEE